MGKIQYIGMMNLDHKNVITAFIYPYSIYTGGEKSAQRFGTIKKTKTNNIKNVRIVAHATVRNKERISRFVQHTIISI